MFQPRCYHAFTHQDARTTSSELQPCPQHEGHAPWRPNIHRQHLLRVSMTHQARDSHSVSMDHDHPTSTKAGEPITGAGGISSMYHFHYQIWTTVGSRMSKPRTIPRDPSHPAPGPLGKDATSETPCSRDPGPNTFGVFQDIRQIHSRLPACHSHAASSCLPTFRCGRVRIEGSGGGSTPPPRRPRSSPLRTPLPSKRESMHMPVRHITQARHRAGDSTVSVGTAARIA